MSRKMEVRVGSVVALNNEPTAFRFHVVELTWDGLAMTLRQYGLPNAATQLSYTSLVRQCFTPTVGGRAAFTDVDGDDQDIVFVGINPLSGKWVAACDDWTMKISEIEEDDFPSLHEVV